MQRALSAAAPKKLDTHQIFLEYFKCYQAYYIPDTMQNGGEKDKNPHGAQ